MTIDVIRDQLKKLHLPAASLELENILQRRKKSTDVQWLSELLSAELDARSENAIERRIKRADFPERRSFEQFDWNFNRKIKESFFFQKKSRKILKKKNFWISEFVLIFLNFLQFSFYKIFIRFPRT